MVPGQRKHSARKSYRSVGDLLAVPQFTTAQVANATGVPAETIRTWFKREILSIDEKDIGVAAEAVGLGRLFSGKTAMVVAIMGRLTLDETSRVYAEYSKRAAYTFVISGCDERQPCCLFPSGETLLILPKGYQTPGPKVVNFGADGKVESWHDLFNAAGPSPRHFEVLALDELWQSVFQNLGIRDQLESELR